MSPAPPAAQSRRAAAWKPASSGTKPCAGCPPTPPRPRKFSSTSPASTATSRPRTTAPPAGKKRLGPLAPIALGIFKLKSYLFLIFKLKFLLGFVGFFGLYWAMFGWKFALGFTLSILIHEMGHYYAVRRRGLKADLPMFLPGLGAYVRWYNQGMPLGVLAEIALFGPLFGLGAALLSIGLYAWTRQPIFEALAYVGAWVNLVNLIPVLGLDGAQATYALSRLQRGLILAACVILFALMHEGVFLFLAAGMTYRMFTNDTPEQETTGTLVGYLLLLFVLGAFLYVVHDPGRIAR